MKSLVSIAKGEDVFRMVEQAIEQLGGVASLIPPGRNIVLKPNAGHLGGPRTAINTSPEIVRAVIRLARRSKPARITIAEASAIGCKTEDCLRSSGILKVAQEEGIDEIIDIKSYGRLVRKAIESPTSAITHVDLPDFLLDPGCFLINLPIFKSHTSMVFTCALKNLKGVVQDRHHLVMHTTNLAGALADLGAVIQPDLNIVDMVDPMEGYGPHAGTPVHVGCVLAGSDMVACDSVACRIAGLPLGRIDYFDAVARKGLGNFKPEEIEVIGNSIEETRRDLHMPYLEGFNAFPEYKVLVGNACSTCQGLTSFNITRLKSLGFYGKCAGSQVVVGAFPGGLLPEGLDLAEPVHLMGRCASSLRKRIEEAGGRVLATPGCPPAEPHLSWNIMDGRENVIPELVNVKSPLKRLVLGLGALKARGRMEKETRLFMKWLEARKRA